MRPIPDRPLNPKAVALWRLHGAARTALLTTVFVVALRALGPPPTLGLVAVLASLLLYGFWEIAIVPQLSWARWRFGIQHGELVLARGVLLKRRIVVPLARVERVDSIQDPISRSLRLWSLVVSTAASQHEIPALDGRMAAELRRRIRKLVDHSRETL